VGIENELVKKEKQKTKGKNTRFNGSFSEENLNYTDSFPRGNRI
jgi:hypothetical protein